MIGKSGYSIFLSAFLVFCSGSVFSQDTDDKTLSPYFEVISDDPETDKLPLKSTTADVKISGVIADVTITQTYKNEGSKALEAIYTFPSSTKAAVYAMQMKIGDRTITAKIKEKEAARQEYEQAKTEGKRTSLLEQQRPNVFTMNVANIMPGDEIKVELKYTELLVPVKGTYQFVYPTVVGPRYSNGSGSQDDAFVSTPYQTEGKSPYYDFDIKVGLSAGMPIQNINCETHKINTSFNGATIANISLDSSETKGGNRDLVLEYQLSGAKIESGLLLYEHGDENFFLLMVQPPKNVKPEEIPPREYIFIVDVSGSMRGFPMDVSKKLLRNLVVNLRPEDKFNILLFAGTSGWMADASVNATGENVDKAVRFIDEQRGSGSTAILPALEKALNFPRQSESLSRSFVVITDGYVHVEKEAFDLIRQHANEANTFVFGIGSSVNRYIIEGMAHVGRGEPMVVTGMENPNEQAEAFREYINRPVLTQITADFGAFDAYDTEPVSIPDVMSERPIIIFGKYKGTPEGTITIKGYSGKKKYKNTFDVSKVKADKNNVALRYLWARERIKLLDDYKQVSRGSNEKEEVTQLGLKYNLLTAYTSFIAVDEKKVNVNGQIKTVKQVLPLPEGVSNSAVGFDMQYDCYAQYVPKITNAVKMDVIYELENTKLKINVLTNVTAGLEEKIKERIDKNVKDDSTDCEGLEEHNYNVLLIIQKSGAIKDVIISGSSLGQEQKECLRERMLQWHFGDLKPEKEITVKIIF